MKLGYGMTLSTQGLNLFGYFYIQKHVLGEQPSLQEPSQGLGAPGQAQAPSTLSRLHPAGCSPGPEDESPALSCFQHKDDLPCRQPGRTSSTSSR